LIAAATTLFAGHAAAGNQTTQGPLTIGPCSSTYSRPPVSIFGSGADLSHLPKVRFDFWVSNESTACPANNVQVNYTYTVGNKATKAALDTVTNGTTVPSVFKSVQHVYVDCTPKDANTYCWGAYAWIPGPTPGTPSGGGWHYSVKIPNATIGPLKP